MNAEVLRDLRESDLRIAVLRDAVTSSRNSSGNGLGMMTSFQASPLD